MMHAGFCSDIDEDTHVGKNKLISLLFPLSVSSLFNLLRLKQNLAFHTIGIIERTIFTLLYISLHEAVHLNYRKTKSFVSFYVYLSSIFSVCLTGNIWIETNFFTQENTFNCLRFNSIMRQTFLSDAHSK
jgi:hypothetical protein